MQIPQGIMDWTVFSTGLLMVAYRIHGIDAPRAWVEWMERQFTYATNLRFLGGILLLAVGALGYYGGFQESLTGWLFLASLVLIGLVGLCLLLLQNHLRHIVFASAESSDKMLRISSIVIVLAGLCLALVPFLLT